MLFPNIDLKGKTVLITGAAGFIGANLTINLLQTSKQINIIGLDNINDYYDISIKKYRLNQISNIANKYTNANWKFIKGNISDKKFVCDIFKKYSPSIIVNLAAQAGVRYSITNPDVYIESNILGFYNILEACRLYPIKHLIYASSSSVYGTNEKIPYHINDKVDNPVSLYAATKKSNELLAHSYSKLYNIPSTGLRFFTVYGPAGRPDMAYFIFTKKLLNREKIQIFNYGNCQRDFTYIDDIIEGIIRIIQCAPEKNVGKDNLPLPPYRIYNLGNNKPINLLDFIQTLQDALIKAGLLPKDYNFEIYKEFIPMQPGDVPITYADISDLERDFGYKPTTNLHEGLRKFVEWYKDFYKI